MPPRGETGNRRPRRRRSHPVRVCTASNGSACARRRRDHGPGRDDHGSPSPDDDHVDPRLQLRRLRPPAQARQHRHELRSDPEVARELRQLDSRRIDPDPRSSSTIRRRRNQAATTSYVARPHDPARQRTSAQSRSSAVRRTYTIRQRDADAFSATSRRGHRAHKIVDRDRHVYERGSLHGHHDLPRCSWSWSWHTGTSPQSTSRSTARRRIVKRLLVVVGICVVALTGTAHADRRSAAAVGIDGGERHRWRRRERAGDRDTGRRSDSVGR